MLIYVSCLLVQTFDITFFFFDNIINIIKSLLIFAFETGFILILFYPNICGKLSIILCLFSVLKKLKIY